MNIQILLDRRNPLFFHQMFNFYRYHEMPDKIYFVLTVDVEPPKFEIENILNLIEDFGRATFFIDTKLLETNDFPDVHPNEVGSHSYDHSAVGNDWWIKKDDIKYDYEFAIRHSSRLIHDYFGKKPVSFRAPKWSIDDSVYDILHKDGYLISSSHNIHDPRFEPAEFNGIVEIPVSRLPRPILKFKFIVPFLSFRSLIMYNLIKEGVDNFLDLTKLILSYQNNKYHRPFLVFACHSWEINEKTISVLEDYLTRLSIDFNVGFVSLYKLYKRELMGTYS